MWRPRPSAPASGTSSAGWRHVHFGTFQLTDEAIDEPVEELGRNLRKHAVKEGEFRVPAFGETIAVD
jgi:hypothetical protein